MLTVLRVRPFLFLWLAEIFSQIAINMVNFILIIVVYKLTNSNTAVAGVVITFTAPAIILGLLAGAYVDRWNKKYVLIVTNLVRAVVLVALAFFHSNLIGIYVLSLIAYIATQFFIPAETPMIPRLVSKSMLLSANALFGMGLYASVFIAYALSTPVLNIFGESWAFILLGVLFVLSAICAVFIYEPEKENVVKRHIALRVELKHAIGLMIRSGKIYHSLLLLALSQILILIMAVVGPGYAKQILGIKVDDFPLFFVTPGALGMVLGGVIVGNFFHKLSKEKVATAGVLLSGLCMLLLPFYSGVTNGGLTHTMNTFLPPIISIGTLHIMVLIAFVLGFANALVFVPSNVLLQEETTDEVRGKLYGGLNALVGILSFIPIIAAGTLADLFGVGNVIIGIGIGIIIIGIARILLRAH